MINVSRIVLGFLPIATRNAVGFFTSLPLPIDGGNWPARVTTLEREKEVLLVVRVAFRHHQFHFRWHYNLKNIKHLHLKLENATRPTRTKF